MEDLQLEDPILVGHPFTCLAVLMVRGNQEFPHKLRSMVSGSSLEFHGHLPDDESTFLLVKTMIKSIEGAISLQTTDETAVIPRPPVTVTGVRQVVELCAGIGCLGWGMKAADFQVILRVDHNDKMNQFSQQLDNIPTLECDICDSKALVEICKAAPEAGVLTSGVACQPYSKLGDKKMQHDIRAQTLPSSLKVGFLTRKAIILLECVDTAQYCQWVQNMIQQFVQKTHYYCCQGLLNLQDVWPARRSRWWCLLVHPGIGPITWKTFPVVQPKPMVIHVLDSFCQCEPEELRYLELDKYEKGKFSMNGLERNMVQPNGQMNTSLHSCGSQLFSCPCGCRKHPFSENRLTAAGLHGLLIQVGPTTSLTDSSRIRHIHPVELSLLNGMQPGLDWGTPSQYKMALCGLGQLASPLQAGWIASQIRVGLAAHHLWKLKPPSPNETLKYMMQQLLMDRDRVFGAPQHPSAVFFNRMVWGEVDNFVLPNPFEKSEDQKTPAVPMPMQVPSPDGWTIPEAEMMSAEPGLDGLDNLILQTTIKEPYQNTPAYQKGAVAGFEVRSRDESKTSMAMKRHFADQLQSSVDMSNQQQPSKSAKVEALHPDPVETSAALAPSITSQSCEATDLQTIVPDEAAATQVDEMQQVCIVHVAKQGAALTPIVIPIGTTACQLTIAEQKLGTMTQPIAVTTAMGEYVKQLDVLQPDQFIILHDGSETPKHFGLKCPCKGEVIPPSLSNAKRDILLWQQLGWVALDEMNYYISMVGEQSPDKVHAPLAISDNSDDPICPLQFILDLAHHTQNKQVGKVGSAILYRHHWSPIMIVNTGESFEVHTTHGFAKDIAQWSQVAWKEKSVPIYGHDIASVFPADCGFQTIGWLYQHVNGTHAVVNGHTAGEWRGRFHRFLESEGIAEEFISNPLAIGGMAVIDDLQKMVQEHGVKPNRSRECADAVLQKLGTSAVQQIMKSPKPWADLKARTNALSPPLRIVTSDELQDMIKNKVQQGGSLGRKSNKVKTQHHKNQDKFHLRADQIVVPPSVFRQEDGTELQQISSTQISTDSQGIVVTNIDEAIPYFSLAAPVTKEGVGLLILDFDDQRIPNAKQIVKVPAHCAQTNEPIIFTAALLQLGCKRVQRNIPESCIAVQEVENQVLRIVVYKDQYPHDWSVFSSNPVRQLMTQNILSEHQPSVLDVWDRQFLTTRLTKCSPVDANLFAVNIRVQSIAVADICKQGGKDGVYVEPRDATGRFPDDQFQVIWLQRTTYGEAALANQTTQCESTLVRSGDRYGIRVSHENAETVHRAHRPDLVFLKGADLKKYTIGPLPYGTTKQSLAKIFKSWDWPSRPIGPQGQAKDRSGVNWQVQASAPPSHWIFQLAHGDVMITPDASNAEKPGPVPASVLASENTIRSLKSTVNQ